MCSFLNLNLVLFSFNWQTRRTKLKKTYVILVCGYVDILETNLGAKIKMMILAWLCRFNKQRARILGVFWISWSPIIYFSTPCVPPEHAEKLYK